MASKDDEDNSSPSLPSSPSLEEREHFMRQALHVARRALQVGEVPVGCVIVLQNKRGAVVDASDEQRHGDAVIVSHGANQVNATRDATRHAEIVAIDRMLTSSRSTDRLRLPPEAVIQSAHGQVPESLASTKQRQELWQDRWVNEPDEPGYWKNSYGWGSGKTFTADVFQSCDLYVTCEPCIMCAAALAKVGIGRVFFGCRNDRFGGCGSLMGLHEPDAFPSSAEHRGYTVTGGILEREAITLLRSFYDRENFHAPDEKRKRKGEDNRRTGGET